MYKNAKHEFLDLIRERKLECAWINYDPFSPFSLACNIKSSKSLSLPQGYTEQQLADFLAELDFEYDAGFGTQEIKGVVWFRGKEWADRGEYDGSEWWQIHSRPPVPKELKEAK